NSDPVTFTGTIDFAEDESVQISGKTAAAGNRTLPFYSLTESYMPKALPATGISKTAVLQSAFLINKASEIDHKGLHLEIPAISVSTDLVSVTLNEKDEWDVAGLTHQAGILSNSALPGMGTTLIAGHNHLNESEAGPFLMLHRLVKNDRIIITDASGRFLFYRVYANELREPTDSQTIYQSATPGSLVLFTCEEEMPEGGYAYRRVVYAEPLQ
ncbi:MAG: class F sortase, partial [Anaerolineaceae bacterium]|nr:class F sortase [Anaerolineaceae bacterium]